MKNEYDAIEGKLVQRGMGLRSTVFLILAVSLMACGVLVVFLRNEYGGYHPSQTLGIVYWLVPALIWSSVVLFYRIDRVLMLFAAPFAVLMTLIWLGGLFTIGPV